MREREKKKKKYISFIYQYYWKKIDIKYFRHLLQIEINLKARSEKSFFFSGWENIVIIAIYCDFKHINNYKRWWKSEKLINRLSQDVVDSASKEEEKTSIDLWEEIKVDRRRIETIRQSNKLIIFI